MKKIELGKSKEYVCVDDSDYDFLIQWKWTKGVNGLVKRQEVYVEDSRIKYKTKFMHREIMKVSEGLRIEIKDGNNLNLQRNNLKYKNVEYEKYWPSDKKWIAWLKSWSGRFISEAEAIQALEHAFKNPQPAQDKQEPVRNNKLMAQLRLKHIADMDRKKEEMEKDEEIYNRQQQ